MLLMVGQLLGVEHKSAPERTDERTGEVREAYDYYVLHVLEGWTSRALRLSDDFDKGSLGSLKEGQRVEVEVTVSAWARRGEAQLSWRALAVHASEAARAA